MKSTTNVTIKKSKTGSALVKEVENAKKLAREIIARHGRDKIAAQFGITPNRVYKWELVPPKHVPVFWAVFCDEGETMEMLNPDMFIAKG